MDYEQTLGFLFSQLPAYHRIGKAAYKNNLSNSIALDEYFGNPHRNFSTIHVAGTNGKGSVSHMIASILHEAGYKTGLYTSPHLKDFRERIKINGVMIPENRVVEFVKEHKGIIAGAKPTESAPWHFNLCRQRARDKETELSAFSPAGKRSFHELVKFGPLTVK